jgi:16S rRNA (guanine966-N2)-methyltransferase
MRVIGGRLGGRTLATPKGRAVRPSSSLVRGAIFNSLDAQGLLAGAAVADLFAGSGALGIEALSRGAARAVFVEEDRRAAETIEANLTALDLHDHAAVVRTTVERWVTAGRDGFDVVLADPPYDWEGWDALLDALVMFPGGPPGIVVAEARGEIGHPAWHVAGSRHHGGTVVTQLRPGGAPGGAQGAQGR